MHRRLLFTAYGCLALFAREAAAAENAFENVKAVPPPGLTIPDADRVELEKGVSELGKQIESLQTDLSGKPALLDLLPDMQIYHKAVDWALRYNEFYRTNEIQTARQLLAEGMARVKALLDGRPQWVSDTGLVVRAYLSRIDGSVQPYGLVVPPSYHPDTAHKFRLDFWFHGRGEQLSELAFVSDREKNRGEFTPADTIVLHLYGRYCNANRFAGETDLFEALSYRRQPACGSRFLDGGCGVLAICDPLCRAVGGGGPRRRVLRDRGIPPSQRGGCTPPGRLRTKAVAPLRFD
jgi:hypothetical protein